MIIWVNLGGFQIDDNVMLWVHGIVVMDKRDWVITVSVGMLLGCVALMICSMLFVLICRERRDRMREQARLVVFVPQHE